MHISSKHLSIQQHVSPEGLREVVVEDASSNGTWIDGERLERGLPVRLLNGSEIVLPCEDDARNSYTFTFTILVDPNSPSNAASVAAGDAAALAQAQAQAQALATGSGAAPGVCADQGVGADQSGAQSGAGPAGGGAAGGSQRVASPMSLALPLSSEEATYAQQEQSKSSEQWQALEKMQRELATESSRLAASIYMQDHALANLTDLADTYAGGGQDNSSNNAETDSSSSSANEHDSEHDSERDDDTVLGFGSPDATIQDLRSANDNLRQLLRTMLVAMKASAQVLELTPSVTPEDKSRALHAMHLQHFDEALSHLLPKGQREGESRQAHDDDEGRDSEQQPQQPQQPQQSPQPAATAAAAATAAPLASEEEPPSPQAQQQHSEML